MTGRDLKTPASSEVLRVANIVTEWFLLTNNDVYLYYKRNNWNTYEYKRNCSI